MVFNSIQDGYFSIGSASGQASVNNLAILPIIFESELLGVIEAGAFHDFSEDEIEFLKQAADLIGISLQASFAREKLSQLVKKLEADANR